MIATDQKLNPFIGPLLLLNVPIFTGQPAQNQEFRRPAGWEQLTADTNPERITAWRPGHAIMAVLGGPVAVVDIDTKNGASIENTRALLNNLGITIYAEIGTPSGGRHFYIAGHPDLPSISASQERPGLAGHPGVEILSHGRNVFLPGTTRTKYDGAGYTVIDDNLAALADGGDPNEGGLVLAEWAATNRATPTRKEAHPETPGTVWDGTPPDRRQTAYLAKALEEETVQLAGTGAGGRNHALNAAAFSLGTLVGGAGLDEAETWAKLTAAAEACGLTDDEGDAQVAATLHSGIKAGKQHPRTIPAADQNGGITIGSSQPGPTAPAAQAAPAAPTPPPGHENEPGHQTLNDTQAHLERFVVYPGTEYAVAHTLWCAHAHVVDAFDNTPRIAFLSPEPGSGKSRALEVTETLTPRPVHTVNASPSYIFRKISDDAGLPTILVDEADAIFNARRVDANEELRSLFNSGYRAGATAGRAAIRGKEVVVEDYPSFCAVAFAGLNQLPDTIMTRSVVVPMQRRRPDQRVEPYRRRRNGPEGAALCDRLAWFTSKHRDHFTEAWPDLPDGIEDRDADVWEPLIAIADAAGGEWPARARAAAVAITTHAKAQPATLGIRLLADLRAVFEERAADALSTVEIINALVEMDDAPWANIKGEEIDPRFLARMLRKYDVTTNQTIRVGGNVFKGYNRAHLADAWARYTPDPAVTAVTDVTGNGSRTGVTNTEANAYTPQPILSSEGTNENEDTPQPPRLPDQLPVTSVTPVTPGTHSTHCRACGNPLHPSCHDEGIHPNCTEEGI